MKTKLSVNLNKIALIRNARDDGNPSPVEFGEIALKAGAAGLTVHPRPDQRHIRATDVAPLSDLVKHYPDAEYNIEGNPFQMIGKENLPAYLDHFFKRIHHLHNRTKLHALHRIVSMQRLVATEHSVGIPAMNPEVSKTFIHSICIFLFRTHLPVHQRLLKSLREVDAMDGTEFPDLGGLQKHFCKIPSLLMQKVAQLQKIFLSGLLIKP